MWSGSVPLRQLTALPKALPTQGYRAFPLPQDLTANQTGALSDYQGGLSSGRDL